MTNAYIINMIRKSGFPKQSALFIKVNRIAYIDARLWETYSAKTNPMFETLKKDALFEMIEYIDKSINVLRQMKTEADKYKGSLRFALNGTEVQGKITEALKHYVRIEKGWESLNNLADSIERSGMEGQEKVVYSDLSNAFSDISIHAQKAIDILKDVRKRALDIAGV